ncbi:MAG: hypothetical protein JO126_04015 [Alphaproteobacteria bacterium]|nr:hypothetical protein [Alphaproteobacteria bacterium]
MLDFTPIMRKKLSTLIICIALLSGFTPARAEDALADASSLTAAVPASIFFPIFPEGAGDDTPPAYIPVASNQPLDQTHPDVRRAVIIIHDFSRDASKSLSVLSTLASGANDTTIIIAPQFLTQSDITRFADHLPEKGRDFARWSLAGWASGEESVEVPGHKGISSFTTLDLLMMLLADRANFPDLREIVLVGHGMGGDFVQRYAAVGRAPDIMAQQGLETGYIVANASSYLYLTGTRARGNKNGLGNTAGYACPHFNQWPYGLDALPPYAKHTGANAIKMTYPARRIIFIDGETAAQADPAPDTSCGALVEGQDRVKRLITYDGYIHTLYGAEIADNQRSVILSKAGFDAAATLGSPCGVSLWLDGQYDPKKCGAGLSE